MGDDAVDEVLAGLDATVAEVAERLRLLVRQTVPDAVEEPDADRRGCPPHTRST